MYSIKNKSHKEKQSKNICQLNHKDKNDANPLVDMEFKGYHVQQFVFDFGSQVNITTSDTWNKSVDHNYMSQEFT